jgi:hypothetical protein
MQEYVDPANMCNGREQYGQQHCLQCRTSRQCSTTSLQGVGNYHTLFNCYSGEISYDTTVCVDANVYRNPANFECRQGEYLDTTPSASSSSTYREQVYLSPTNAFVAEISPLDGNIMVHATVSAYKPMVKSAKVLEVARKTGADASCATYTVEVVLNSTAAGTRSSTFQHPMQLDPSICNFYGPLLGSAPRAASGAWSVDGLSFFVVWMDGTISKAVIFPEVSDFPPVLSTPSLPQAVDAYRVHADSTLPRTHAGYEVLHPSVE